MRIYQRFCRERADEEGRLLEFSLDYPENFNFAYDVLDAIAAQEPRGRALVWCNTEGRERSFSFEDIRRASCRLANVFRAAGIGRGDAVMLVLKRHYEYWFALLALHRLGALAVPATHMLTEEDFAYRLRACGARAVVCTAQDRVPEKLLAARALAGVEAKLWCVEPREGFQDLTAAMARAEERLQRVATLATDPMLLYFTSGTTGEPKGVIHDFRYPRAHILTAKYWQGAREGGLHFTLAETGWAKASWGKLYGQWLLGSAVMVYDFDNFEPRQLCAVIRRHGVTSFCAPPTVYRYLLRKGLGELSGLEHAATAGELLDPELLREFTRRTGLPLREGYGQTETGLLMANFLGREPRPGSMGRPSPLYPIALLDPQGRPVAPGQVGEVVVLPGRDGRQPGLFMAYLDQPGQYRRAWRDGVYHTGDAACLEEDGCYRFCGRFDDIIKTGGFRVGPDEVEQVLSGHPAVAEGCVIGVADPLRGQAIKALVVPAPGYAPSAELELEIKNDCNRRLAEYKWIRLLEFVPQLPRTISGKIRRGLLRSREAAREG